MSPGAVLSLREGEESERPVRFPKAALAEASVRIAQAEEELGRVRRQAQEQNAQVEASWREAFRRLRADIAALEAKQRELRNKVGDPGAIGRTEAAEKLAEVEAKLAEGRDALDELERQDSHKGIPREWRR